MKLQSSDWRRKGASTVEYVVIFIAIVALALVLMNFMSDDGQSMLRDKIMAIITGVNSRSTTEQAAGDKKETKQAPQKNQAESYKDISITDKQLLELADLAYKDPSSITEADADKILGDGNSKIADYEDLGNGFQAVAIKDMKTGEVIISFRGSDTEDGGSDWWGQNSSIYLQTEGGQVKDAENFVERVKSSDMAKDSSIVLTGHSLGGFHAQNMARKYGLPAVTYNAPGLKPHPASHSGTPVGAIGGVMNILNPNMNVAEDAKNITGANDDQVVNYVNSRDAVGNYGLHYGKVIVTDPGGGAPSERNDYLHPFKDRTKMVVGKAVEGTARGGFLPNHSLNSFKGQFKEDGNIARQ